MADLVDIGRLYRWMETQNLESGPIENLKKLTGGTQNINLSNSLCQNAFTLNSA